ncbi:hypothetical protein LX32DRAFT_110188 [Colletotrichum zoysiae]|uniref:Uncharacterized protein n=1 Tax=Colletotrichum zoysiae TaxID=1216348 RepID=A0AAD9H8N2_9PEZI|nr:hypothetical protein LX32DRAFT_110188 [Colletotrichum zoysiae]
MRTLAMLNSLLRRPELLVYIMSGTFHSVLSIPKEASGSRTWMVGPEILNRSPPPLLPSKAWIICSRPILSFCFLWIGRRGNGEGMGGEGGRSSSPSLV